MAWLHIDTLTDDLDTKENDKDREEYKRVTQPIFARMNANDKLEEDGVQERYHLTRVKLEEDHSGQGPDDDFCNYVPR